MAKRDKRIQFRVSEEEDAHLRQAAADAGLDLSDYLRAATLHPTVVFVDNQNVVLIPSTITLADADEALQARFRAILEGLQGQVPSPAPAAPPAESPPAPAPPQAAAAPVPSAPVPPAPDSVPAPQPSPAEGEQMVGASASQAPPAAAAAAGAIPGPGEAARKSLSPAEGAAPGELEPAGPGACPHCGGANGQHQSFCEIVTGESPVEPTEEPDAALLAPEGTPIETQEQFVMRRIGEQEAEGIGTGSAQMIAEAEWRQRFAPPPAAAPAPASLVGCANCGTLKSPAAACPDCGAAPRS